MAHPATARAARTDRRLMTAVTAIAALIAGIALYAILGSVLGVQESSAFDASLPNPMGGPARAAPGEPIGEADFGGLRVSGNEIAMGDVALGVTYVPSWQVDNPTGRDVAFTIGQPQVLDGCCPGPVYADGRLTQADQQLTVPAGGSVHLQFPLQMHAGMDGPHHLAIPLRAADSEAAVHVTGNFTADAAP